ncbi:ABC transporter permease [Microbacterium murale]|uniref:Peptide/nickel transport system permease protein n=1 Tax=Microbacterium murale TaxID=1081040 RepID=A0ABU0P5T6_9MICO|nr:ABC transporter permease [Microbacterium murale]MDQ0642692.1 peptide/nickel transport system permease protein [Microbacterium murale]
MTVAAPRVLLPGRLRRRPKARTRRPQGTVPMRVGISLLAVIVLLVTVVPFLPNYDPFAQSLSDAMLPPFASAAHPLGTDSLGRDVLSRLALAGLVSVGIAAIVVALNFVIGITVGLIAGYRGGWLDTVLGSISDVQLAMPVVILLIALSAVFGPSTQLMVITLGLTYWVGYARVARALAMGLRDRDFVVAPLTQGGSHGRTVFTHVLPQVISQMVVIASFDIAVIVCIESSLDYLGLGVQPPVPSWGAMITEGQKYLQINPMLVILPGIALFLLVAGMQFLSQRFTTESVASVRKAGRR